MTNDTDAAPVTAANLDSAISELEEETHPGPNARFRLSAFRELRTLRASHDAAKEDGAVDAVMRDVGEIQDVAANPIRRQMVGTLEISGRIRNAVTALVARAQRAEAESAAKDEAIVALTEQVGSPAMGGPCLENAIRTHAATIRAAREAVAARKGERNEH